MTYCQRHPLSYTIIIECAKCTLQGICFLIMNKQDCSRMLSQNLFLTRNKEDTTLQNNTNIALLDTETLMSISSSSIGTQTAIASSSTGTQTSLSLSANSPRKSHLHRKIQKYKKQISAVELTHQKDKEEDINILFTQLDKFYPKEMSDFLKQQACCKKRQQVEDIVLHSNNIAYPYTFPVQKRTNV